MKERNPKTEYLLNLAKLHILVVDEKNIESEKAEALRDEMNPIWFKLSENDKKEIRDISFRMYREPDLAKNTIKEIEMNDM